MSAATVVAVKAYQYYSMPPLMRANLEALTQNEGPIKTKDCYIEPDEGGDIKLLLFCDSETEKNGNGLIYPCIAFERYGRAGGKLSKCIDQ